MQNPEFERILGERKPITFPIRMLTRLPYWSKEDTQDPMRTGMTKISLEIHGMVIPIVVNMHGGKFRIVDGWKRSVIWRDMGNTTIKCIMLRLDEAKEKDLHARLNTIESDFNEEVLQDLLLKRANEKYGNINDEKSNFSEEEYSLPPKEKGIKRLRFYFKDNEAQELLGKLNWLKQKEGFNNLSEVLKAAVELFYNTKSDN